MEIQRVLVLTGLLFFCIAAQVRSQQVDLQLSDAIKAELARLQAEIATADAQDGELASGLVKTLIKLRAATLRQTKAMLEQRSASRTFGIALNYTIDGKTMTVPENRAEQLEQIRARNDHIGQQDRIARS